MDGTLLDMTSSLSRVARIYTESFQGAVVLLDRGLRLQDMAVRNAARSVASDRVAARLRADAAASLAAAAERPELSVVGA
jgi:hypothetical protein